MTTIFTVDGLQRAIQSVDDLVSRPAIPVESTNPEQMYQALQRGEVEAIVLWLCGCDQ
jgi:ABC-type amino acid transport substrate-binding protein